MKKVTDNELIIMASEENEEAKNELFNRYNYIIDIIIKKYKNIAYNLGIDFKDFYSEGLYGFSDALVNFNQNKSASFATFISLCVERRLQKQLIQASRQKNKINLESLSLDSVYNSLGMPLKEVISDDKKYEPLDNMTKQESYQELITNIKSNFSELEYSVFTFLVNGFDYITIATILDKKPKQIDNTIQRIKSKLKKILETVKNTCN